jgi:tripartite-type tricarboxylate transporter receptor subunit TctC
MATGMLVGVAGLCGIAHAQKPTGLPDNYPNKPVRMIIASSPGGAIDICGRTIAAKLSERWGARVIAENRAGNNVAFDAVMRSAPDGYTLLAGSISAFVGAELILKSPFNVRTEFPPIAQCIHTPYIASVNNELPVKNLKEFIAYAHANPNKLNYAYGAIGSAPQLFGELLKVTTKIDMQGIPFKGVGPAYIEQMAGRINLTVGTTASSGPMIKSGKIRGIAVTTEKRVAAFPDLQTVRETLPNFDTMAAWVGVLGVKGTSPAIINALNKEINAILSLPDVGKLFTSDGSEVPLTTPEQFRKVINDSLDSTARIVKQAGIKTD